MAKPTDWARRMYNWVMATDNYGTDDYNAYRASANAGFGGTRAGGAYNTSTGLGTSKDKIESTIFLPTLITTRDELQTIYRESWAARKFVDTSIRDMFVKWRKITSDIDVKEYEKQERMFGVRKKLAKAMIAGRLYGTGMILIATRDAKLDTPLDLDQFMQDDLAALHVIDRFDVSIEEWETAFYDPMFKQPVVYRVNTTDMPAYDVHASRVMRFDGQEPLTVEGWSYAYDRDWGASELVPAIHVILQEAAIASGAAHLTQLASIGVAKFKGYKDMLASEFGTKADRQLGDLTPRQLGEQLSQNLSIFNLLMMDSEDEYDTVGAHLEGLPDLIDRFSQRMATLADIPATRWAGQSPLGMNATGESDMVNYSFKIAAEQENMLDEPMMTLDTILSRNLGQDEPPEYEWIPLVVKSSADEAAEDKLLVDTLDIVARNQWIDPQEARQVLIANTRRFQDLDPDAVPEGMLCGCGQAKPAGQEMCNDCSQMMRDDEQEMEKERMGMEKEMMRSRMSQNGST